MYRKEQFLRDIFVVVGKPHIYPSIMRFPKEQKNGSSST